MLPAIVDPLLVVCAASKPEACFDTLSSGWDLNHFDSDARRAENVLLTHRLVVRFRALGAPSDLGALRSATPALGDQHVWSVPIPHRVMCIQACGVGTEFETERRRPHKDEYANAD